MAVDKNISVLVVDDFETMRRAIKNLLKQLDFPNVDAAEDGEQAFQMLQRHDYGLVISDWDMQPMTGIELLHEIRKNNRLKGMPFILVTAEHKAESLAAVEAAGASYLVKPFTAEMLKGKIASLLGPL